MLIAMAADVNYPLINVVRREEQQVQLLNSLVKFRLNLSEGGFAQELSALCHRLQATAAFEAIAGDTTGTVINAMPPGSTAYVYGALSQDACGSIDPIQLVFHHKTITGFYLGNWLDGRGAIRILCAASRVQRLIIDGRIATTIQRRLGLDEAVSGLKQYVTHMTDGKVLIMPNGSGENLRELK